MLHNFSGVELGKESYEEQFLEGTLVLNSVYLLSRFLQAIQNENLVQVRLRSVKPLKMASSTTLHYCKSKLKNLLLTSKSIIKNMLCVDWNSGLFFLGILSPSEYERARDKQNFL